MADTQLIARQLLSDLKRDFGLTNEQAAGVVGNLMHESAGFTTLQEANPTVPGSAGGFGFAQWTGERRKSFDSFVADRGLDRNSYAANYGFLKHELATDRYERAQFNKVKKAETAADAARIVSENYLRPGTPHNASRIRYAEQVLPYADMPVPPGEIDNIVGTLTDTVRMPPQPATIAPNLASLRSVTSPSGGNGELQQALNRLATTKANAVTPQMRRPALPAMGTPDVGALYAGIYDQPKVATGPSASDLARGNSPMSTLTANGRAPIGLREAGNLDLNRRKVLNALDGSYRTENSMSIGTDRGEALIPTVVNGRQLSEKEAIAHYLSTGENLGMFATPEAADRYAEGLHERQGRFYAPEKQAARPLPVKQSSIERGPSRTALAASNLTSPGAIDASVRGAGANTDQALAAALTRRVANLPAAVPSSPIDRGETRVAALPASKPRVTVSTPFTTPQSAIERGAARILEASPIGQPPATRVVQSVPIAPPQSTAAAVLSASDRARAAKAAPAVFRSIPGPAAVAKDETRLLPSAALPPANYGVAETAPVRPPTPLPALARAAVPPPAPPYRAVATQLDTTPMPTLPRVRPSVGMGVPAPVAQAAGPAPTPMPRLQRGGIFGKPQILGHDINFPGALGLLQSATMAMNNASGPFNNGADNLIYNRLRGGDFNTPGAATAQSAGFLFAPKPGGGWLNVGRVDPKISAADRYASLNSGNGGPRTAADRAGKSLSQSGGARSFME